MKKSNSLHSVFAFFALASGIIWFGAYISRLITTYQMFEPVDLTLKNYINNDNISAIIQTTFPLVNLTFFAYLIFIFSFTIFLIRSDYKLKQNGWLFIVSMIIYLTFPFELVLLIIDCKLIILFFNEQFSSAQILELIRERITLLNSFPIILILSYLSIPFFLITKPFTLKFKNEN